MTAGAWRDTLDQLPPSNAAVDAFVDIVELTLRRDVNCVTEYVSARIGPVISSVSCPQATP